MKKRYAMMLFCLLLLLGSGCSSTEAEPSQQKAEQTKRAETTDQELAAPAAAQAEEPLPKLARPLTEVEKMMMKPPGKYGGDRYDATKIREELDRLPADLSTEEYFQALLGLMAEDYRPHVTTFVNFDATVEVNHAKPTENIRLPEGKKTHFSILLDASGSMKAKAGSQSKMDAAKESIRQFVSQLPENASVSLRIYGHKGSGSDQDKAVSCGSTEEVYRGTGYQASELDAALGKVQPAGWTPIARALQSVREDVPADATETVVYVVSDGIETCGGDPVQAAKKLQASNVKTVVNIIGFDVDSKGQEMLKQVAAAGNGTFIYAHDDRELKKIWREEYDKLKREWYAWKEEGKREALNKKEEKKKLATDTKEAIKFLVEREKQHLLHAREYIKGKYGADHPIRDTHDLIMNRKLAIYNYAVDTGNHLWSEAVDQGNAEWSRIVDEGNNGAQDAIKKRDSQ
ncbi:VWA domain-containing protein [Aneurinibacillus sp. BA2021]|nr:VWA domain-containing protein [Aneurinibacillus sp. BA2021]